MRLLPASCVLCHEAVTGEISLCDACYADLPRIRQSCFQCGLSVESDKPANICGTCQNAPPAFDYLVSALRYDYPVDYLVTQLKFRRNLVYAKILSQLLLQKLTADNAIESLPDLIIPVPLHTSRLRKRGFNQSLEIAHPISKAFKVALSNQHLIRVKQTLAQSTLDKKERLKNLQNSFELVKTINQKHVVIIDDVVTTGATVNELASLLKAAGVEKVGVWAAARA